MIDGGTDTDTDTTTGDDLLATLREATGRPGLAYAAPPAALTGGFYAEMFRFRLADPPEGLAGDLVARILPDPDIGAWEATVQRHVAGQGFPTPAVRLTAGEAGPLGRYLIVMDHVDGRPPMAGLSIARVAGQIPRLVRRMPDQLAAIAARLHALDPGPLAAALDGLDTGIPTTTAGFVEERVRQAAALGQDDIAGAGERLLAAQPPAGGRLAVTHGDLHPLNLLVGEGEPVLIDWSLARVAHPAFTLGFTDLVLASPPIPLPRAAAAVLGTVGRRIARRFLRTYRRLTDGTRAEVGEADLAWHRRVHALRILVEMAGWDRPVPGHPWLLMEPVARSQLGLSPRS